MAEKKDEEEVETPREFSSDERVKVEKENSDTDIFEEVLDGKKEKKPIEKIDEEPVEVKEAEEDEENEEDEEEVPEDEKENLEEEHIEQKEEIDTKEEGAIEEGSNKEDIKETIMQKASLLSSKDKGTGDVLDLNFLEDEKENSVFIGRKRSVFKQYGFEGALLLGKVKEASHEGKNVYLDSLNPHVVFVCGARGSGKSYALGIIAEELALKNKNVGTIMIDPIGVFWSMRYPNKEKRELDKLKEWNLKTGGLSNIKVFIPEGLVESVPKTTYDKSFAIQTSLLTGEDWTLTFSIDRFSVSGLLLEQTLKKVEKGYTQVETGKKINPKGKNYSIDDLVDCLRTDSELNSREKGYKQDSIRALASRFEAAKNWGIFSELGTPLGELSREGQLTILDTSFLDDNVTALVIGVLSRRILAARKISTRKEAAQKIKALDVDQLLELEIPPTWLIVDEAHTLIPSGNEKTPATVPLIEYVKQGRRPGCSLATQQPSAIDTKVLSQLDIILTHKLVFDDDVKAVNKRTPTIIPAKYRKSSFIKSLPVGVALVGDRREETSRAFVMEIRPRFSQHEGRDMETGSHTEKLSATAAKELAVDLINKDILKHKELSVEKIEKVIESMNLKYGAGLDLDGVLDSLEEKGLFVGEDFVSIDEEPENLENEGEKEIDEVEEKEAAKQVVEDIEKVSTTQLLALPTRIDKRKAEEILNNVRKRKIFGLFGTEETIENFDLKYLTLWKINYEVLSRSGKEFLARECFINSHTGEFVHFSKNTFVESNGLKEFFDLDQEALLVLSMLRKGGANLEELVAKTKTASWSSSLFYVLN